MAGRSLGALTLDLILKFGGFEQGWDKAARTADKRMKEIEKRAKQMGTALGLALAAGAGIAAAAIKNTIDEMDDLSKAAKTVGMDTEGFSRLAYAAELANVSQEELQSGLGRLVKAQGAAMDESSKQAEMFKALGIAITDVAGAMRPTRDVMLDFADRFAALKGSPEALAAGLEIFGRGFQTFVPLIEGGSQAIRDLESEADQLGVTLSTETGDAAEQFNDNITRLKASVQGFWMEVASGLLPQLVEASDRIADLAKQGGLAESAITLLSAAVDFGVGALEVYSTAVSRASIQLEGYIGIVGGLEKALIDGAFSTQAFNEGLKQITDSASAERKALLDLDEAARKAANNPFRRVRSYATTSSDRTIDPNVDALRRALAGGDKAKSAGKPKKSDAEREAEQLQKAYESMNERLAEQIALFGETTEASRVRYEVEVGGLSALSAAQKEQLIGKAEQLDQMRLEEELREAADDAVKRETEAYQQRNESNEQLIDDMEAELALYGMTNAQRERAIALSYLAADATDAQKEAVAALADELRRAAETEAYWQDFEASMSDAFADFATGAKSAKDALGDFLDALFSQSVKAAADYFSEAMTNIFRSQAGQSGAGASSGGWADLFGAIFGGQRANGGWAGSNQLFEVNERGFEMATVGGRDYMLTGSQPVEITPNHRIGGGLSQVNNISIQGRITRRTEERVAQLTGREAQRALARTGR